ncbi:Isoleucyl-tRNA synthetase [Seinonella peptonophila]|uniref:Isoleucine--tRNA ligase n=1 Tax=Seinonella peptonophila TaxID=112248 RepID=A0A1M4UYF7_9BACL|nr:isoleucine--tRNA ligase [Seinonella peptonophila]SHE61699.1 Isoleucyl-tRNA synthetase [Seinonella peptonophila]
MQRVNVKEKAYDREQRVLQKWRKEKTFEQSIKKREGSPSFVFYEGPPTANGMPHIGHVLGRVIKDFLCRYRTMTGYQVVRKAGWDTHGLPVELGVEKELGISGKQEIEEYGIEAFVEKCKQSVFTYEREWRKLTEAIGYWTDMENPYITLNNQYIESVWNILATIHQRGLLQRGHRVSPYCPSCQTAISSHEVAQGYKQVKDISVTVKFPRESAKESFLAWTTTPWTLPSNAALAINPSLSYARVKQGDEIYIVAEKLVPSIFKEDYEVLSTHPGHEFVGEKYEPPFDFAKPKYGHVVIAADYVSDQSGTGIVHTSPAHGEDDYQAAKQNGISLILVVDKAGKFTKEVTPLAGRFVKDCDVEIVKLLAQRDRLFSKEKIEHKYPFCWRCKTPLLYYAMESWFIQTTAVKDQLIENNRQIKWYPDHLQEGRFGKFLEDLVDWNISRNRYWGTPLNIWECTHCDHQFAPHSHEEMRKHALGNVSADLELHRPYVDEVKLKCSQCDSEMVRTKEVIDVWFDSGSMPFAQYHYPFENQEKFKRQFPADIICEGVDQTRGWFFSLLAVSTLFNGQTPYKAVISTGHILDENGQKMSKSKGNVVDPWEIINRYGADAFRWALFSDSAPWNSKRFSERIVAEAKSKVIDTLNNVHAFYALYADIDHYEADKDQALASTHRLDRWIRSRLNSTLKEVRKGLDDNDLLGPARLIEDLIDDLSNWYIRRSRDRFWGSGLGEDKKAAYRTLYEALVTLSKMVAPYAPFLAEEIYQNLCANQSSVHHTDFPQVDEQAIDLQLEAEMKQVRQIVELARNARNEAGIKTRQPLSLLYVLSEESVHFASDEAIIKDEINVKEIQSLSDTGQLFNYDLKLNLRVAGPQFGRYVGEIQAYLKQLSSDQTQKIVSQNGLVYQAKDGAKIELDVREHLLVSEQAKDNWVVVTGQTLSVALKTTLTPELKQEGFVREVIRSIQEERKKLDLPVEKRIKLVLDLGEKEQSAVESFEQLLHDNVLLDELKYEKIDEMTELRIGSTVIHYTIVE